MKAWAVFLALSLLVGLAVPAYAQIPPTPHAFFGSVTLNAWEAGIGVTVVAKTVDGVVRGSITTTETGKYGNASPLLPKLLVQGEILGGSTIEFYVEGNKANQTYPFTSGLTTELNLTAWGGAPTPTPTPTPAPALPDPTTLLLMGSVLLGFLAAYLLIRARVRRTGKK